MLALLAKKGAVSCMTFSLLTNVCLLAWKFGKGFVVLGISFSYVAVAISSAYLANEAARGGVSM